MNDIYLKAPTADALYTALEAAGVIAQDETGYHVTDAHRYALDVIGVIYRPTGKMLTTDEGETQEMAPLPGWHANLRVMGEFDAETLADLAIDTPKSPARGWA
jgi:hypothetical protein